MGNIKHFQTQQLEKGRKKNAVTLISCPGKIA